MDFIRNGSIWFLLAIVSCFFYNTMALNFSKKILRGFTLKSFLPFFVAAINTVIVVVYVSLRIPFPFLFFAGTILFFIEFSFLSKASTRQKIFGASVFFFNIGSIHLLILVIHARLIKISIVDLFKTPELYSQSWTITCLFLIIVLWILQKKISISNLKKISCAKNYTRILSLITISILAFLTLESFLIIRAEEFKNVELIVVGTTIFTALLFYFFFLYSIQFLQMHVYKRKNDQIQDSHMQLLLEKKKVEQEIVRDGLTGLFSKKYIYEILQKLTTTKDAKYAVLFIDLNGLKLVNDTYGHEEGDAYICNVAKSIQEAIREEDLPARVGGDEFLIIMIDIDCGDVESIVARINENVSQQDKKVDYSFAVSIGSVCINNTTNKKDFETILLQADEAMRQKKRDFYNMVGNK